MFVWNGEEGSLNETTENHVDILKYRKSWNPRRRLLVVATESSNEPAHILAAQKRYIIWQVARIVNLVVLIPNQFPYLPLHVMSTRKTTAVDRLNLYTWFPYALGKSGKLQEVILLDECVYENNYRFTVHAHLYLAKVKTNFMGCPIKVAVLGHRQRCDNYRKFHVEW